MISTIICDPVSGLGIASGSYSYAPHLASNEVICEPSQAAAPGAWKLVNGQIVAASASAMLPGLCASLADVASQACQALTGQIVPDATHQAAYTNAAALVGPGAVVPVADPAKTTFASLAAANNAKPQDFANLVVAIASTSMQLQAARTVLGSAISAAKSASDLAAALTAFEASLSAVVSAITSAGIGVTAPKPIVIAGINA